jgi:uncharacterized protein (DUF983 family)
MVATREAYCPRCDEVKKIMKTVEFQTDYCAECGADVPE